MTTTVVIRDGVEFTPDAAAAFIRAEAAWGSEIDVNSTYRSWDKQMKMFLDWTAYASGSGPKPNHSRAIHPRYSKHTSGLALDSDDWVRPGFIAHMAEYGFIRTAANDPTERHHFEYQEYKDKHKNDPIPAQSGEDMFINIAGKKGKRRGGLYYVSNGVATFIGPRRKSAFPKFTNEKEIAILQSQIKGLK